MKKLSILKSSIALMRPHQWLKNILVFLPLAMAHDIAPQKWLYAFCAFITFCLCASSVYIFNDMVDVQKDKRHPTKKYRPLASGDLSKNYASILLSLLLFLAIVLSVSISHLLLWVMLAYILINLNYSLWLKKLVFVDIIILAVLYAVRVLAGGVASHIILSDWLLAFSLFLFFSLAIGKRVIELQILEQEAGKFGRGYLAVDKSVLQVFGIACSCIAVLVLALYIQEIKDIYVYRFANMLWLLCVLLFYWLGRLWILIERGQVHDDPVLFAVTDRITYAIAFLSAACYVVAVL